MSKQTLLRYFRVVGRGHALAGLDGDRVGLYAKGVRHQVLYGAQLRGAVRDSVEADRERDLTHARTRLHSDKD